MANQGSKMKRHLRALDGMLLAAAHYQNGNHKESAKCFAAAMAESDVEATIMTLEKNLRAAFEHTPEAKALRAKAVKAAKAKAIKASKRLKAEAELEVEDEELEGDMEDEGAAEDLEDIEAAFDNEDDTEDDEPAEEDEDDEPEDDEDEDDAPAPVTARRAAGKKVAAKKTVKASAPSFAKLLASFAEKQK
ncbi:hypothetical protein [Achromobacter phage Motura]|uniref:Uncharacterized protein n=1 Tax=Achromobacter phage Motura TaxID=2591403 RepID=A0A514CSY6_9CAUD|nr:hypothetical protein H1O15_gp189 [Achromobacter phage Motura]QDH83599.1 hypothetical protein [Achromobacter phage Motura]